MLDESGGQDWVSRRNPALRPISTLGQVGANGIPYLAPEVQLFYKAKEHRPKDEHDFAQTLLVLTVAQRAWLRAALTGTGIRGWNCSCRPAAARRNRPKSGMCTVLTWANLTVTSCYGQVFPCLTG